MKRAGILRRQSAEKLWPNLCNFLVSHFHEDTFVIWGSDDAALAEGVAELSTELLRELRKELRDWNGRREASDMDIVKFLQDGFGVNRVFKKPDDARAFMDKVDAELLRAVKERTEGNWKP